MNRQNVEKIIIGCLYVHCGCYLSLVYKDIKMKRDEKKYYNKFMYKELTAHPERWCLYEDDDYFRDCSVYGKNCDLVNLKEKF